MHPILNMSINKVFYKERRMWKSATVFTLKMLWIWSVKKKIFSWIKHILLALLSLVLYTKIVWLYICSDMYTFYIFTDCIAASPKTSKFTSHFTEEGPSRTENVIHSCGLSASQNQRSGVYFLNTFWILKFLYLSFQGNIKMNVAWNTENFDPWIPRNTYASCSNIYEVSRSR